MCDGCWLGSADCAGVEKAYALSPVNGQANGMRMPGVAISKEDARISATYCADQMKNEPDCSKQFIGVSMKGGQCWCAKQNDKCDNFVSFTSFAGHFFKLQNGSEEILEGESEGVFEGSFVVGSDRRLSTACMYACMYEVISVFVWSLAMVTGYCACAKSFRRSAPMHSLLEING